MNSPGTSNCLDVSRTYTGPYLMPVPTLLATSGPDSWDYGAAPIPAGTRTGLQLGSPHQPASAAGVWHLTKAAPCPQRGAAEEGGRVPRLPFSCCQQEDCQKEALFSE